MQTANVLLGLTILRGLASAIGPLVTAALYHPEKNQAKAIFGAFGFDGLIVFVGTCMVTDSFILFFLGVATVYDGWYDGVWTADGDSKDQKIYTSDDGIMNAIEALADSLNEIRPDGKAPVKFSKKVAKEAFENTSGSMSKTNYICGIISTVRNGDEHWNPMLDDLRKLGLINGKHNG